MVKPREPLVSIITLNYNQPQLTREFLESTRKLCYTNFEILVCDMASDQDPTLIINAAAYPNTRLLRSSKNLGYSAGNNWGIRQANGDYFFIVNNDTIVTPDLIGLLLKPFELHPSVGVTSPKIKFYHQPEMIQYAGFNAMNPFTGRTSTIGEMQEDRGQYDKSGPTHASHGCAMMISRQALEKAGMFPEKFFLYYEEWDLSARITKFGYTIWYAADAVIFHKESMSVGKENPIMPLRNAVFRMSRIRPELPSGPFVVATRK